MEYLEECKFMGHKIAFDSAEHALTGRVRTSRLLAAYLALDKRKYCKYKVLM